MMKRFKRTYCRNIQEMVGLMTWSVRCLRSPCHEKPSKTKRNGGDDDVKLATSKVCVVQSKQWMLEGCETDYGKHAR